MLNGTNHIDSSSPDRKSFELQNLNYLRQPEIYSVRLRHNPKITDMYGSSKSRSDSVTSNIDYWKCNEGYTNDLNYATTTLNDIGSGVENNSDIEISLTTARTSEVLQYCNSKIIRPFNAFLIWIGWKPLSSAFGIFDTRRRSMILLDLVYLILLWCLLFFSYVYQIIACRFVMSRGDTIQTIPPVLNLTTTTSSRWMTLIPSQKSSIIEVSNCSGKWLLCNHISTTYVLPNILHFIGNFLGFWVYRINRNEDIYALMEKTFQYSSNVGSNKSNYKNAQRRLLGLIIGSIIWVCLSITNHALYDVAYNTFDDQYYIFQIGSSGLSIHLKHFFFIIDFLGAIVSYLVTSVTALNYVIYCELITFYVKNICKNIENRAITIGVIKNDMHNVSIAIKLINGRIGLMMTLTHICYLNLIIAGLVMVFNVNTSNGNNLELAFRIFFVLQIIPLLLVPTLMCGRANDSIKRFKHWIINMSVYGYRKENRKDIDSLLLYINSYKYKVRMAYTPIEGRHIKIVSLFLILTLVTIIQIGLLDKYPLFAHL